MLLAPPVVNDTGRVAVPLAKVRFTAFPGEAFTGTIGAVPIDVPPAENVTVPVGPTPVLCVPIVAVSVTFWPIVAELALEATPIVVAALVIVTTVAGDVLVL
jgi:hypothetical protein